MISMPLVQTPLCPRAIVPVNPSMGQIELFETY